jgi:hypothetical protein
MYDKQITFDGGFSSFPYLNTSKHCLHIHPSMWSVDDKNTKIVSNLKTIYDYMLMFSKDKYNFQQLYLNGYNDCKKNKHILDTIFV